MDRESAHNPYAPPSESGPATRRVVRSRLSIFLYDLFLFAVFLTTILIFIPLLFLLFFGS